MLPKTILVCYGGEVLGVYGGWEYATSPVIMSGIGQEVCGLLCTMQYYR